MFVYSGRDLKAKTWFWSFDFQSLKFKNFRPFDFNFKSTLLKYLPTTPCSRIFSVFSEIPVILDQIVCRLC